MLADEQALPDVLMTLSLSLSVLTAILQVNLG